MTLAEHDVIRERVNKARTSDNEKDRLGVLPICVGDGDVRGISFNLIVPDVRTMTLVETVELIVNRFHLAALNSQGSGASPVLPLADKIPSLWVS